MIRAPRSLQGNARMLLLVLVALAGCEDDSSMAPRVEQLSAVKDVRLVGVAAGTVALEWTALDDVEDNVYYDIHRLNGVVPSAADAARDPLASPVRWGESGGTMRQTLMGLSDDSDYFLAIKTRIRSAPASAWSDVVIVRTPNLVLDTYDDGLSPALSPSGNQLSFTLDREIWVQVLGTPRIWKLGPGDASSWSPDGSQIVVRSGSVSTQRVLIYSAIGGSPIDLTRSSSSTGMPTWSPDGAHIAYSVGATLFVVDPVQLTERTVEVGVVSDRWSWASDSNRLITESFDKPGNLTVADLSKESVQQIELGMEFRLRSPAWSPGDDWVLFWIDGGIAEDGIWAVHLSDLNPIQVTMDGRTPVWYPGGKRMLFAQDGDFWSLEIGQLLRDTKADSRW